MISSDIRGFADHVLLDMLLAGFLVCGSSLAETVSVYPGAHVNQGIEAVAIDLPEAVTDISQFEPELISNCVGQHVKLFIPIALYSVPMVDIRPYDKTDASPECGRARVSAPNLENFTNHVMMIVLRIVTESPRLF